MRLFGKKAAAEAPRPALQRAGTMMAGGGAWPQGYEAQVRAGYIANPIAQRSVRIVEGGGRLGGAHAAGAAAAGPRRPVRPLGTGAMSVRFAGYAALFERIDSGGDAIAPGAFAPLPATVPLLWQHRGAPIGAVERLETDARGLRVIGRIDAALPARLVAAGALAGLSFGYRVRAACGRAPRRLTALDLIEISLVAHPMQPLARVHAIHPLEETA